MNYADDPTIIRDVERARDGFRFGTTVLNTIFAVAMTLVVFFGLSAFARADVRTLRIIEDVPTVLGIAPPPDAGAYYDARQGRYSVAPRARVYELAVPVGATPCGGRFEVLSGPEAGRGCVGR